MKRGPGYIPITLIAALIALFILSCGKTESVSSNFSLALPAGQSIEPGHMVLLVVATAEGKIIQFQETTSDSAELSFSLQKAQLAGSGLDSVHAYLLVYPVAAEFYAPCLAAAAGCHGLTHATEKAFSAELQTQSETNQITMQQADTDAAALIGNQFLFKQDFSTDKYANMLDLKISADGRFLYLIGKLAGAGDSDYRLGIYDVGSLPYQEQGSLVFRFEEETTELPDQPKGILLIGDSHNALIFSGRQVLVVDVSDPRLPLEAGRFPMEQSHLLRGNDGVYLDEQEGEIVFSYDDPATRYSDDDALLMDFSQYLSNPDQYRDALTPLARPSDYVFFAHAYNKQLNEVWGLILCEPGVCRTEPELHGIGILNADTLQMEETFYAVAPGLTRETIAFSPDGSRALVVYSEDSPLSNLRTTFQIKAYDTSARSADDSYLNMPSAFGADIFAHSAQNEARIVFSGDGGLAFVHNQDFLTLTVLLNAEGIVWGTRLPFKAKRIAMNPTRNKGFYITGNDFLGFALGEFAF